MDLARPFQAYARRLRTILCRPRLVRLGPYFAIDAVYECRSPESLSFRVDGRAAILERFALVTDGFDRTFDSRTIRFDAPRVEGERVSIRGAVVYTLGDAPPLRLPFAEVADYRGGEIIRLEDCAEPADILALGAWMVEFGDRLGVASDW